MTKVRTDPQKLIALDAALREMLRTCPVSDRVRSVLDQLDEGGRQDPPERLARDKRR